MKNSIYLLILITIQLAIGPLVVQANTSSRYEYGSNTPPFWYPLTAFEKETLTMVGKEERLNQEGLLRLALMAAGVREDKTFKAYLKKITAFLKESRTELERHKDPQVKGRLLHDKMHRSFMLPARNNGRPQGYILDQSSLAVLLDSGRFNCTSSAILYMILAQYCGLEVRGAIMPEHVFVELKTGKNSYVDIETTSINGFAKAHDRKFYQRQAAEWASWRGLRPVTYQDYQQRQFISTAELIALNMDDRHVRRKNMDEEDRLRLKEAQSAIMATDKKHQLQRMGLYNNEFNRLSQLGDYQSLARMFSVVKPILQHIASQWPADIKVNEMLSQLSLQQAITHYHTGAQEEAFSLMETSLDMLREKSGRANHNVRQRNLALLNNMVNKFLANSAFSEALALCDRFSLYFKEESSFSAIYRMIYSHWANFYWQRQEWDAALTMLNKELNLTAPDDIGKVEQLRSQIASCYLNRGTNSLKKNDWEKAIKLYREGLTWASANTPARTTEFRHYVAVSYKSRAISYFNRQDWALAVDDFARQLEWADDPAMQQSAEKNLGAVYNNWRNDYSRRGDLPGARNILQKCTDRFPGISFCREQLQQMGKEHRF